MRGIFATKLCNGKNGCALTLVFVGSFFVLLLRHPHAIFGAQFWAEDGAYWYVDVYQMGLLKSLTSTSVGYFQTLSRVVAGIAVMLPLKVAPAFMNLSALAVQSIPAVLLVSSRFSKLIPDMRVRFLLAGMYLLMPNSAELHANITNAQWYLALAAVMVYLADVSKTKWAKVFDATITSLSALSGPFIVFLAPIALFRWWREGGAWRKVLAIIAVSGAFIQAFGMFFVDAGNRISGFPDISLAVLVAIMEKQIFLGSVMGWSGYGIVSAMGAIGEILLLLSLFSGIFLLVYALMKSKVELRIFIILSFALFFAGMVSPTIGGEDRILDSVKNGWDILFKSSSGIRYWLMPIIAFHATLIWGMAYSRPFGIRVMSLIFLSLLSFGIVREFHDPSFTNLDFSARAEAFEKASPGEVVEIPLNPAGWSMRFIKR